MPVGRPTKFTPETRAKLLDGARRGLPQVTCAHLARVHQDTLIEWLRYGREGNPFFSEEEQLPYSEFYRQWLEAESEFVNVNVGKIAEAKDWKAQAWLLERRRRKAFGKDENFQKPKESLLSPEELIAQLENELAKLKANK